MSPYRLLIPLLCPWVLQAQTVIPSQYIQVTTCARADSVLGPIPDGLHPGLRGSEFAPGLLHATTGGYPEVRHAGDHTVSFTLDILRKPHPATPKGYLHVSISGPPGLAMLRAGTAPKLTLELPDSIVIRPQSVLLGRYSGPDAFASAPLTGVLTPASVTALARASRITIVAGDQRFEAPGEVLASLHDAYRTALCGAGQPAPPN